MIILVTGDRSWGKGNPDDVVNDYSGPEVEVIGAILSSFSGHHTLIHGDCAGVDRIAGVVGEQLSWTVIPCQAHWKHTKKCPRSCKEIVGRAAGPIRNRKMLDTYNPDIVLAFHNAIYDNSRGTLDCLNAARERGILVRLYNSLGQELQIDVEKCQRARNVKSRK